MKILLAILVNVVSTYTIAQTRGYAGYIRMGSMHIPDTKNAMSQIVPGINGFTSNFYGIGGELQYRINKVAFGGQVMVLSHGPVNSGDRYAEPFTGDVIVKAGYAVLDTRNVFVYPSAGIGMGYVLVNTYQKSGGNKTQLHTIYLIQPVFDLGLNGDVIAYKFKDEMPTGILPIGLRAGYRFAFASDNWHRINGSGMSNGRFSPSGWYLSLALGMGYITSNLNKHK
jgi:hypothetical protein